MPYAYPSDLARFARARWVEAGVEEGADGPADGLPEPLVFEQILSTCYQTSLLREELRPVQFRLVWRDPVRFRDDHGPPDGLHCLCFTRPRPLDEQELRRLSPATDHQRSLIGAWVDPALGPSVWGVLHAGLRGSKVIEGVHASGAPLPPALVVSVIAPGRLEVARGTTTVAELEAGRLVGRSMDVFDARWLHELFVPVRDEVAAMHEADRTRSEGPWAQLDPDLLRALSEQMLRQLIASVRDAHHGGTLLLVPDGDELLHPNPYVHMKYEFRESKARGRYCTLLARILRTLADVYGRAGATRQAVGCDELVTACHRELSLLNEAVLEFSFLVAGLAAVDGAVLLSKRFELLGFGAEIAGNLADIGAVARALDLEGEAFTPEATDGVGTRHRSAYRLCAALPPCVAVVVSQDEGVRFVRWCEGRVTYWSHAPRAGDRF